MPPNPTARLLLVDDDEDVRDAVQGFLEQEGITVETASNGQAALDALQHLPLPALVLLDLMMPVMDGEGFLAAVSSNPQLAAIPVLVVSASTFAPRIMAAFSQVVGVLTKPYDPEALLSRVRGYVTGRRPLATGP